MPTVLAIETSCDETGVAILRQTNQHIDVLAAALASQVDIHAATGGVIPNVAAREHTAVIKPLIEKVLTDSHLPPADLDAIAVTVGPGLQPALAIGVTAAQTLAFAWDKPIIPVHHIEGHIYSALLRSEEKATRNKQQAPTTTHAPRGREATLRSYSLPTKTAFPSLALIVSGGHTMLILVRDHLQYDVLGQTRDDAVGEAFDKVARLLGFSYPGGPALANLAADGDPDAFSFARPMQHSSDLDFSFSGLKTEVLYTIRDLTRQGGSTERAGTPDVSRPGRDSSGAVPRSTGVGVGSAGDRGNTDASSLDTPTKANLAASFQQAAIDSLILKTATAIKQTDPQTLLLAGGVAANQLLRQQLTTLAKKNHLELRLAPLNLCGDNAIMIAQVALLALATNRPTSWEKVDATARINIENFSATSP